MFRVSWTFLVVPGDSGRSHNLSSIFLLPIAASTRDLGDRSVGSKLKFETTIGANSSLAGGRPAGEPICP